MSFPKNNGLKRLNKSEKSNVGERSGVFLSSRHISWLVSSMTMICFFVFVSGYFLGKKKAVEKFYSKVSQDSFSDHIYYSMCSMCGKDDEKQVGGTSNGSTDNVVAVFDTKKDLNKSSALFESTKKDKIVSIDEKDKNEYYAELIGFGTERAARKFSNKLLKDNISVSVRKRRSKTSKGKVVTWYQVVTEKFSDRNDLIALVEDISTQERLSDVRIVSC